MDSDDNSIFDKKDTRNFRVPNGRRVSKRVLKVLQIAKAMVGALLGSRAPELFFSRKNRQHIKICGEKQPFVHELGEKNTFSGAQRAPEKLFFV